jgi:hypothetical protein
MRRTFSKLHLSSLVALKAQHGPIPSEELLIKTLSALRALVFPQLRPVSISGSILAEQVISGFTILTEQSYNCTGKHIKDATNSVDTFLSRVSSVAARAKLDVTCSI